MCSFSTGARIVTWICLSHTLIIISTLVFTKLEGCEDSQQLNYVDSYLSTIFNKDTKQYRDIHSKEFFKFKEGYNEALSKEVYWRMRNEFNDAAKVYVFVLSSYTTIGNFGITPQTWEGRLYYVLSLPLGILFYCFMLHNIAVEAFEIFAYAAVSIFPKKFSMWTIDQRELYEKLKVSSLSILVLTTMTFLFALLAMLSYESYLTGVYSAMNLIFTISGPEELISFTYWESNFVAFILTFIYFISMLFLYMILYSVFIMFRYNNLHDIVHLFKKDYDSMSDINSEDELMRDHEDKELFYYNAKEQTKNYNFGNVYQQQPQTFQISPSAQYFSDDSDQTLEVPKQKKMLRKKRELMKLKMHRDSMQDNDDSAEIETPPNLPNIEVTKSSPVYYENNDHDDLRSLQNYNSRENKDKAEDPKESNSL